MLVAGVMTALVRSGDEDAAAKAAAEKSRLAAFCRILSESRELETQGAWDVGVYLEPGASTTRLEQVRAELAGTPGVTSIEVVTQDEALVEFGQLFSEDETLGRDVRAEDLPASVRVRLRDPDDASSLADRFESQPDIESVLTARKLEGRLLDFLVYPWSALRPERSDVAVFLEPAAPTALLERTAREAERIRGVRSVRIVTQSEALEEFNQIFAESPGLLDDVEAEQLPPSVRVLADEAGRSATLQAFTGWPGVSDVIDERSALQQRVRAYLGGLVEITGGAPGLVHIELARNAPNSARGAIEELGGLTTALVSADDEQRIVEIDARWSELTPAARTVSTVAREQCGLQPRDPFSAQ